MGGLAVVDPLLGVYPKPRQFGENLDSLECFQVVDEDVEGERISPPATKNIIFKKCLSHSSIAI